MSERQRKSGTVILPPLHAADVSVREQMHVLHIYVRVVRLGYLMQIDFEHGGSHLHMDA